MAQDLTLSRSERVGCAAPLGGFLEALHGVPASQALSWGLSTSPSRRDMAERTVWGRKRAQTLAETPYGALAASAVVAMADPPPEVTASELGLVHGDLHAGQLLFSPDRRLSAVIDWGEVAIGDRAYDLLGVYSF